MYFSTTYFISVDIVVYRNEKGTDIVKTMAQDLVLLINGITVKSNAFLRLAIFSKQVPVTAETSSASVLPRTPNLSHNLIMYS